MCIFNLIFQYTTCSLSINKVLVLRCTSNLIMGRCFRARIRLFKAVVSFLGLCRSCRRQPRDTGGCSYFYSSRLVWCSCIGQNIILESNPKFWIAIFEEYARNWKSTLCYVERLRTIQLPCTKAMISFFQLSRRPLCQYLV